MMLVRMKFNNDVSEEEMYRARRYFFSSRNNSRTVVFVARLLFLGVPV